MKTTYLLKKIKAHPLFTPNKKIVIYTGDKNPEILFIGEAPGKEENRIGIPFVGRSGKLLIKWIAETNIESFGITNIVPLIPLDKNGRVRKPTKDEMNYFEFFWKNILFRKKPKGLILLGTTSMEAVLNKKNLFNVDYTTIEFEDEIITLPYVAVYHPAYYLYRHQTDYSEVYNAFNELIKKIRKEDDK